MSVWEGVNFTHRFSELPSAFFTYVTPQLLDNTRWVLWNGEFAQQFGLPAAENEELLNVFAGQKEFAPFAPLAMKYAVINLVCTTRTWVTAVVCCSLKCSTKMALGSTFTSKGPALPLILEWAMAEQYCVLRSVNICAVKRWRG